MTLSRVSVMTMRAIYVLSLLVLTTANRQQDILNLYSTNFIGDGTYYWFTENGTCSYPDPSNPDNGNPANGSPVNGNLTRLPPVAYHTSITAFVALNKHQFFGSYACGMCFLVNGSGEGLGLNPIIGQHIVFVKDMCPECKKGDVDFSKKADGRWKINIRAIQCPVGHTSIEYKFQGSNKYYLKLQVRNARIPATSLEVKLPDMTWSPFIHTLDGFWTKSFPNGVMHMYPIRLRLTAANGDVIEDTLNTNLIVNEKVLYGDGKQFSLDNSLPT